MKPKVKTRGLKRSFQGGHYVMHIAKKKALSILCDGGFPYTADDLNSICARSGNEAVTSDFRSVFKVNGKQEQLGTIEIPRAIIAEEILAEID